MTFAELARSLGNNIGLTLHDDVASPLEIRVNELAVTLTEERRGETSDLVVSAILGTVPDKDELGAYRVMLDANVFWTATADCTLGVNAQTREAVICYRAPIKGLDGNRLGADLGLDRRGNEVHATY